MGKAVEIIDERGVSHVYPAKTAEELTVADWMRMVVPPIQLEEGPVGDYLYQCEILSRYLGCDIALLRKLPFKKMGELYADMTAACAPIAEARKHDPKADNIEFEGVTYKIPKNIGEELSTGQYGDIVARLEKAQYEDESLAIILGVMLEPPGGYDASTLDARIEAFKRMPAIQSVSIVGFFFVGSEQLRKAWSHFMTLRLTSRLQQAQQGLTDLASVGASTPPSPEPLP